MELIKYIKQQNFPKDTCQIPIVLKAWGPSVIYDQIWEDLNGTSKALDVLSFVHEMFSVYFHHWIHVLFLQTFFFCWKHSL